MAEAHGRGSHEAPFLPGDLLRGAKNASAVADLVFLRDLDVPTAILFDNVSGTALADRRALPSDSLEVFALKRMLAEWPADRTQPVVLAFDRPDIICALPDEAVNTVIGRDGGKTFPGWEALTAQYRALPIRDRHDFKDFICARTGFDFNLKTIRRVLALTPSSLPPESPLYRPIQQLLALKNEAH